MTIRAGLVVAIAVYGASPLVAQSVKDWRPPQGMIQIVGRTDPGGIPDYVAWQSLFRMLSRVSGFPLSLSEDQRTLISETARRDAAAQDATWRRQEAKLAEMNRAGLDNAAIKKALYDIDYDQRLGTLAERDALLKKLPLEARAALKGFAEDHRRSISAIVPVADLDGYRKPAREPLTHFVFYNNRWLNLHHFLRLSARGGPAPTGLSDEDSRAWAAGVEFYKRYADRDLLFDDGMVEIKDALRTAEVKGTLEGLVLDAGVKGTIDQLMPIYEKRWLVAHYSANRAWIAAAQLQLERHEAAIAQALARTYESKWPSGPILVDVSVTAGPSGAYTTGPPTHVTISSSDASLQGLAALEMLFHEASHSDLGNLLPRVQQAASEQHVEVPRQLWHAVLFYTAGELTRRELAAHGIAYREYADERLYTTLCGTGCRDKIVEHWGPRLDGRRSVADSLSALVAAFK